MERPQAWIDRMLGLIELERATEVEETGRLLDQLSGRELEARGLSILRLAVTDEDAGLGGRILLKLARTTGDSLPPGRIQSGDIVRVVAEGAATSRRARAGATSHPSGVVWRRDARSLTVAFDELPDDDIGEGTLRVDRVANDVTYRRMRESLQRLRAAGRGRAAQLREILLGEREPRAGGSRPLGSPDARLNPSQLEAVAFALDAPDVALIHGPPGTGKTTAVAELIRRAVRRGERVLATAPSNIAVDNLAEILAGSDVRVVRVGHPARLLPSVVELSLDAQVSRHPHTKAALELRRELAKAAKRMGRAHDHAQRRAMRDEIRALRRSAAEAENDAVRAVLGGSDVVLATCTGAGDPILARREFDLAVVDEAAQALEAACWIPIQMASRVVLAGDHRQLPPTIISREAERGGLGVTLFDRLMERDGERLSRLLATQYRMHRTIMEYPSRALYDGRLEAHASVARHLLRDLPGVEDAGAGAAPLWFVDTAGCGYDEELEAEGDSRENPGEAEVVARLVEDLVGLGVAPRHIGVITPYSAQVRRLRERLSGLGPDIEVDSVDGFQGREKEALVISLVRSNPKGDVGFLSEVRRLNVAVTRARRHLCVVGDSATVSREPFIEAFIAYCDAEGAYRSAWELG
ncbi:MAG: IGHMBP2 family helicase [Planctomycetes bacterium]|nr:IGHMBP2 family helicase [Planctomycetota bacterium]